MAAATFANGRRPLSDHSVGGINYAINWEPAAEGQPRFQPFAVPQTIKRKAAWRPICCVPFFARAQSPSWRLNRENILASSVTCKNLTNEYRLNAKTLTATQNKGAAKMNRRPAVGASELRIGKEHSCIRLGEAKCSKNKLSPPKDRTTPSAAVSRGRAPPPLCSRWRGPLV
jgi:hypothetical protein